MPTPAISVVIPALNEARNIPYVFAWIPVDVSEVILVEGFSTNGTAEIAREVRPDVRMVTQARRGKGNALACGFAAARGDIIAMLGADGSANPDESRRFVAELLDGADFAKGSRFLEGGGSDITRLRGLGNFAPTTFFNTRYGRGYTDLCYGFNVFWRRHLPGLALDAASQPDGGKRHWGDGFEIEAIIHVRVAPAGLVVAEVPIMEHQRMREVSTQDMLHDGRLLLRAVLSERRRVQREAVSAKAAQTLASVGSGEYRAVSQRVLPDLGITSRLHTANGRETGELARIMVATPGDPTVSVIIAAFSMKRWDYLREAVASVQAQSVPVLETIVVIDHQPDLLVRARRELTGCTVIENAGAPGAASARNTGVAASCGEMVAFLDDDVVATPDWLAALLRHFQDPDVLGVGGRLVPLWATSRPRWFPPEFDWTVGVSYAGMPESAQPVRNVWSSNMAMRRRVFKTVGGFRDEIGKVGTRSRPEDTDLCLRVTEKCDGIWVYEPTGAAGHRVPAERMTIRYFAYRCFREGWGKATLAVLNGTSKSVSTERRYASSVLPTAVGRGFREVFTGDCSGVLRSLAIVAGFGIAAVGFLLGYAMLLMPVRPRRGRYRAVAQEGPDDAGGGYLAPGEADGS